MYLLKIGTIPLPKLYVCDGMRDAKQARDLGIPYIMKPRGWSDEKLVKAVLWRTLANKFPHIKWRELLGITARSVAKLKIHVPHIVEEQDEPKVEASTPAVIEEVEPEYRKNPDYDTCGYSSPAMKQTPDAEYRETGGGLDVEDTIAVADIEWEEQSMDRYIGDLGWYVNVEELQALHVLPVFLDDIANAIKLNLMNSMWMDGYNKKLGAPLGHWQGSDQAPNLIILDTSGSIPSGIAGTMISLIDTLRHQANADLIITSGRSEYWAANTELPDPDKLSYLIGGCNECVQFYSILRKHVLGKHWGNVIVFGDQDSPLRDDIQGVVKRGRTTNITLQELQSTRIDRIMAFHTYRKKMPGYGLWAVDADPKAEIVYNTDWVSCMENRW